jgi:hypothetical protein
LILYGDFVDEKDTSTLFLPRLGFLSVDYRTDPTSILSWMRGVTLNTLSLQICMEADIPTFLPLIEAFSTTLVNLELDISFSSEW